MVLDNLLKPCYQRIIPLLFRLMLTNRTANANGSTGHSEAYAIRVPRIEY